MTIDNVCFIGAGHVGQSGSSQMLSGVYGEGLTNICPGAPSAAVFAFSNPSRYVSVVDRCPELLRRWNSNPSSLDQLPLRHEPGLHHLVRVTRDGGTAEITGDHRKTIPQTTKPVRKANLVFSGRAEQWLARADLVFICVNTPTRCNDGDDGNSRQAVADIGHLESAVKDVARWTKSGIILVIKSTVPVGTAELVRELVSC